MGLLVDGIWSDQWYDTRKSGGRFIRQDSAFRNHIGSERFPAAKGRYHLYISHACPWAHRTAIMRALKKLQSVVSMSAVEAFMGRDGWVFGPDGDPVNNKQYMHQIYTMADAQYTGRVTVPVLWDRKEQAIVNNESSEIIRMFNRDFHALTDDRRDFYPAPLQSEIDTVNDFIYDNVNNGVYKTGFATKQAVYEEEVTRLFDALDVLEKRLETQRYLVGSQLTEADLRFFTTLVRFDPVYVGHFKCNLRRIADYPNLSAYLRDIYQTETIKETVHMDHIKTHYYTSHATINPTQIVPAGPALDYNAPHDRARFS